MTSNVYMVNFRSRKIRDNKISKIRKLMDMEEFKGKIRKKDLTAVKIHFGERGNRIDNTAQSRKEKYIHGFRIIDTDKSNGVFLNSSDENIF
ncbi:MAG: hypothetical protein PHP23_14520 [Desulfobacterales bacterium]|nr:hypothetical protein [Desulfobacterales bacterium]MDD4071279.1 hypothetical protein [Desulfobacterales bacterium]MDD4393328.1 hypothetical protein [Desulfobacterales bacterium]